MEDGREWYVAMILYTTMPQEMIFPINDEDYKKQKVVQINGVSLLVTEYDSMRYQIVRLLSSNPKDFLIESFMPGQIIELFDHQSSFM